MLSASASKFDPRPESSTPILFFMTPEISIVREVRKTEAASPRGTPNESGAQGSSGAHYFSGVRIPYLIRFRTPRKTSGKPRDRDFRARGVDNSGIPARKNSRMAGAGTRALIVS